MLFFTIFIILLMFSFLEILTFKRFNRMFIGIYFLMSIMTALRFGVGTDFFNYKLLYEINPTVDKLSEFNTHSEVGYVYLTAFLKQNGFGFSGWIFLVTVLTTFLFLKYIINFSSLKFTSLAILFCSYWMTYINSGIRNGFSLAIISGIAYTFLFKDETKKFLLTVLLASLFHSSALILLILYFEKILFNKKFLYFIGSISVAFSFLSVLGLDILKKVVVMLGIESNVGEYGISLPSLILRIVMLIFIIALYKFSEPNLDIISNKMLYIYFYGFILYLLLWGYPLLSSRLTVYFRIVDVVLIPILLAKINKLKIRSLFAAVLILILLPFYYFKEINAQLNEGGYYSKNILEYPYVSVFQKEDTIYQYRYVRNDAR